MRMLSRCTPRVQCTTSGVARYTSAPTTSPAASSTEAQRREQTSFSTCRRQRQADGRDELVVARGAVPLIELLSPRQVGAGLRPAVAMHRLLGAPDLAHAMDRLVRFLTKFACRASAFGNRIEDLVLCRQRHRQCLTPFVNQTPNALEKSHAAFDTGFVPDEFVLDRGREHHENSCCIRAVDLDHFVRIDTVAL